MFLLGGSLLYAVWCNLGPVTPAVGEVVGTVAHAQSRDVREVDPESWRDTSHDGGVGGGHHRGLSQFFLGLSLVFRMNLISTVPDRPLAKGVSQLGADNPPGSVHRPVRSCTPAWVVVAAYWTRIVRALAGVHGEADRARLLLRASYEGGLEGRGLKVATFADYVIPGLKPGGGRPGLRVKSGR